MDQDAAAYHLAPDLLDTIYRLTGWISSREVGVPDLLDTIYRLTGCRIMDAG